MFRLLKQGYEVLSDKDSRRAHDSMLDLLTWGANHRPVRPKRPVANDLPYTGGSKYQQRAAHYAQPEVPHTLPKLAVGFLYIWGFGLGLLMIGAAALFIGAGYWPIWMAWLAILGFLLIGDAIQGLINREWSVLVKVRRLFRAGNSATDRARA